MRFGEFICLCPDLTRKEVKTAVDYLEKHHFTVGTNSDGTINSIEPPGCSPVKGNFILRWVKGFNNGEVFQYPTLYQGGYLDDTCWRASIVLAEIRESVKLPEPLIQLPFPSWLTERVSSSWEFLSIAQEDAHAFIDELKKIVQQ